MHVEKKGFGSPTRQTEVLNRGVYPYAIIPVQVARGRWLFVEPTDGMRVTRRVQTYVMLFFSAGWLLILLAFAAQSLVFSGANILKGLFFLVLAPLLVFVLWRIGRENSGRGKQLVVDEPTSKVAIREVRRGKVLWQAESGKGVWRVCLQPWDCESASLKGFCVVIQRPGASLDRAMLLALTRERDTCVRYSTDVLTSVGLQVELSDESLPIRSLGTRQVGRSDKSILAGVSYCAKCRYDLAGVIAAACPECGRARVFLPRLVGGATGGSPERSVPSSG